MNRKDLIIKHFKMMGYEVVEDKNNQTTDIRLRTKKGYGCRVQLHNEDFYNGDFIVEHTVRRLNELIINDL